MFLVIFTDYHSGAAGQGRHEHDATESQRLSVLLTPLIILLHNQPPPNISATVTVVLTARKHLSTYTHIVTVYEVQSHTRVNSIPVTAQYSDPLSTTVTSWV